MSFDTSVQGDSSDLSKLLLQSHSVSVLNIPLCKSDKQSYLCILCYNSRNLISKMDELAALASINIPDFVPIVDTWLSVEVTGQEVFLLGYQICRTVCYSLGILKCTTLLDWLCPVMI